METVRTIILISRGGENFPPLGEGFVLLTAADTEEALRLGSENPPSAVIADAGSVLDGSDTLDKLRTKPDGRKIPLFALTDGVSDSDRLACLGKGVTEFIGASESGEVISARLCSLIALCTAAENYRRVETDPLTGAYTRVCFMDQMLQRIADAPEGAYDLVCLEIESYDLIYGRYGVEICDSFMSTMVKSLMGFLPPAAIMGTAGEGHIVFLMPHIPFEFHAKMMAGCLKMAEQSPFPLIAINAGVCPSIEKGLSAEEIYGKCLLALEGVRFDKSRFIAEYNDELREKEKRLRVLEHNMYTALKEKHFKVYYQPKYSMQGDRINGAEALVRWIDPQLGFMNPGEFIPLFEKNGFIFELDKYILEEVCADLRKWLDMGKQVVPVSVNVSQTDFDQICLDALFAGIADKYGIPHEYIHFEITESAEAPDAFRKSIAVDGFRQRGFEVELDDFGAGYSTLSILKQMPVDVMKIDMSLIRNMTDPNCRAILEGALFTAVRLKIHVVVEGVENEEQYDRLKGICQSYTEPDIQGFYFSKPIPSGEFEGKLTAK